MSKKITVPRIAHAFFKWYCQPERYEELHGDLEEYFNERVTESGLAKAKFYYVLDVIRCFQPYAWRKVRHRTSARFIMFPNYFKVSMRGLMKSPLNSFINVFGLAIAIGICVFAYGFTRWTFSTDQFHKNKDVVFLTTFFADRDGATQEFGKTPRPLGEMLKADFTQVKKVCRVEDRNVVIKRDANVFHERIRYTDPEFLEMFTFPLKWGMANTLADVNSIILSEPMSVKYFGDENPVGRNILVKFDKDRGKEFKVTGVAEEFPKALTIRFDFLINMENLRTSEPRYDFHDWSKFVNATLVQVDKASDIALIERGMKRYKAMQNDAAQKEWAISSFAFEPLATLHIRSENLREDISRSSSNNFKSIIFLALIGVFMLALACFNYINIAIVSAAKRLKEIGVRKSIGATRRVVIVQFMSENIVITFFALFLGLLFGVTVVIPWFEQINDFSMDFRLSDPNLWIFLPSILLLTGIASGIYPAFYISKFQVSGILKGSVRFGTKNPLTKLFLGFQLVLAFILITCGATFTQNSTYLAQRSWGYNPKERLYAEVPDQAAYEQLNAVMAQDPDVLALAGSRNHLGRSHATTVIHMPDREYEVDQLSVDARYFETMGLQLAEGRFFKDHEGADRQSVIVNDVLVKNMGWDQPIGHQFEIDSTRFEIIGVLKEFHSYNFFRAVRPTIFTTAEKKDYRYLSMKVEPGSEIETYKTLQSQWAKLYPEVPFQGGLQEDVWVGYKEEVSVHGKVWRVIACLAVLLAGLGLYGLMTLNVAGRVKEFSIRKVLGAKPQNIAAHITKEYILLFGVALIIGAPVSYILMKFLFDAAYKYHIPVHFSIVTTAVIVLILVLLTTVSTQINKIVKSNPVDGLKAE